MSPSNRSGQAPTLNPFNQLLRKQRDTLRIAWRHPLAPGCGPFDTGPAVQPPPPPTTTSTTKRSSLLTVPIVVTTVGDNQLIPGLTGRKLIYEIVLWNVAAQSLAFYQGSSTTGILLMKLTNFPALTGLTLGFNGNFEMPHWEVDTGQPLTVNLSANAEVDGFIRYRIPNGNF